MRIVNARMIDRDGKDLGGSVFFAGAVCVEHKGMVFERSGTTKSFYRLPEAREQRELAKRRAYALTQPV